MNEETSENRTGALLFTAMVLVAAAIAVSAYVIWDTGRDAKCEEAHSQALARVRRELKDTQADLLAAQADLDRTSGDLARTRAEKNKLEAVAAELAELKRRSVKTPPVIVTDRKFSEMEYDETLKRAMFKNPRIEAEKMVEKPVIILEEVVEEPPVPVPAERAAGLGAGGKYERDAREHEATTALADAIAFEYNNPNATKEEIAAKYREVAGKFSDTVAAREATKILKEILKRDR